mgnify:CR=1 FL=1
MVVNAPLWSLSIEIIFALFLYHFIKLRNQLSYILVILSCSTIFWLRHQSWPIIGAIPYFILGILLRNEKICSIKLNKIFLNLILSAGIFYYVFTGARAIVEPSEAIEGNLVKMLGIGCLLFVVSRISLNLHLSRISIALGKRSFCFYAFHYPVLLFFNYFLDPITSSEFFVYCALSVLCTAFATEIGFRLIDRPSIAIAKGIGG